MSDAAEELSVEFDDGVEAVVETPAEPPVEAPTDEVVDESPDAAAEGVDEPEAPAKVEFTPEQQEILNREIGRKTAIAREAERKAAQLEQQLAQFQQQQQPQRPVIPPMPDIYEDGYEQKVAHRDKIIQAQASYDAQVALKQHAMKLVAEQKQKREQTEIQTRVEAYNKRAKKLGVEPATLQAAGNALNMHNLDGHIINHILGDDQGPAITVHLASHHSEAEAFSKMSLAQQAVYIETKIKPELARKTVDAPPPPPKTPKGKGAPEGDGGLEGVRGHDLPIGKHPAARQAPAKCPR